MIREEQTGSVTSRQLAQFGFDANIDEPQPHGYRSVQPILRAALLRGFAGAVAGRGVLE